MPCRWMIYMLKEKYDMDTFLTSSNVAFEDLGWYDHFVEYLSVRLVCYSQ